MVGSSRFENGTVSAVVPALLFAALHCDVNRMCLHHRSAVQDVSDAILRDLRQRISCIRWLEPAPQSRKTPSNNLTA
jgi:hypothetical protein